MIPRDVQFITRLIGFPTRPCFKTRTPPTTVLTTLRSTLCTKTFSQNPLKGFPTSLISDAYVQKIPKIQFSWEKPASSSSFREKNFLKKSPSSRSRCTNSRSSTCYVPPISTQHPHLHICTYVLTHWRIHIREKRRKKNVFAVPVCPGWHGRAKALQ